MSMGKNSYSTSTTCVSIRRLEFSSHLDPGHPNVIRALGDFQYLDLTTAVLWLMGCLPLHLALWAVTGPSAPEADGGNGIAAARTGFPALSWDCPS